MSNYLIGLILNMLASFALIFGICCDCFYIYVGMGLTLMSNITFLTSYILQILFDKEEVSEW